MNSLLNSHRAQRIWVIAKNDFLQRYYDSWLGVLWAFLNPAARIAIYYLVFAFLIFKNNDPNFILYLFLGVIPWSFFAESTKRGMKVITSKRYLIENIRMSRHELFVAHIVSALLGFAFNMGTYFLFRLFFDAPLSMHALWAIPSLVLLVVFAYSVSQLLSIVFAFMRDLDHVWDIALMAGFWSVPVIWDQNFVFEHYQFMLYINPITGVVINLRQALLFDQAPHWNLMLWDAAYVGIALLLSTWAFNRWSHLAVERK